MRPDEGHRATDKRLAALERRIAKLYGEAGEEIGRTIAEYFESFRKRDEEMRELIGTELNGREWTEQDYKQWRLNQIARGKRFEALRDKIAERMTEANAVAVSYCNDETPGIYSLNRNYTAYTIEQVSDKASFDLWDEQTVKRLIAEQPELMPYFPKKAALRRGIDLEYGKKQITASVTSGILQGKSIGRIADDLQKRLTNMDRDSAIRTARTAVTGAQNAGRMDSYIAAQKMGIKMQREWMATLDNRTRHAHAMLDGQRADIDKPFKVDGYEIMYPGDKSAPGYLVYNCRCTLTAVVDGVREGNTLRRTRDGLIPDMTYAQWEASKRGYNGRQISPIRTDELNEWQKSLQNRENIAILKAKIDSGEISTQIRPQQQAKHIEGTPQFESYKASRLAKGKMPQSVLAITQEEAQSLVNELSCTGIVEVSGENNMKFVEYCDAGRVIGKYYADNTYRETKRFAIYYSKRGTHVVPTPLEKRK